MSDGPGGIGGGVTPAPKVAEAEPAPPEAAAPTAPPTTSPELAEAMDRVAHNFNEVAVAIQQRTEHATQLEQAIIADRQNMAAQYQQVQQLGALVQHVNSRFGALEWAGKHAPNNKRGDWDELIRGARKALAFVQEVPPPPPQPLPGETPPGIEDEFGSNSGSAPPDKVTH